MTERTPRTVTFDAREYDCPACGAHDRWEGQYLESPTRLVVWCDCGRGELVLVLKPLTKGGDGATDG